MERAVCKHGADDQMLAVMLWSESREKRGVES
jgi:hypothetical protein